VFDSSFSTNRLHCAQWVKWGGTWGSATPCSHLSPLQWYEPPNWIYSVILCLNNAKLVGLVWVWGLLQPGFVRWAPPLLHKTTLTSDCAIGVGNIPHRVRHKTDIELNSETQIRWAWGLGTARLDGHNQRPLPQLIAMNTKQCRPYSQSFVPVLTT